MKVCKSDEAHIDKTMWCNRWRTAIQVEGQVR